MRQLAGPLTLANGADGTDDARVTQKGDIKTYSNQRGDGRFFGVTFMDDSGEIRATIWNHMVDEYFEKLQEGKVYYVSKAKVNLAKKKFSNVQNEYELAFEKNTEIEEVCSSVWDPRALNPHRSL